MIRKTVLTLCTCLLVAGGVAMATAAGLATSASKVDASAQYTDNPGAANTLRVRLDLAAGWHVNAHPASLDFLVPTTIKATAGGEPLPLTIVWPPGHNSGIELSGTAIKVYSDDTIIPVRIDAPAAGQAVGQPTLKIRVQACSNKGLCLPPSTLSIQPPQA